MVIFVLLVAALTASPSVAEPQFRKDYQYVAEQNAFYKPHRQRLSWHNAYKYCNIEGGSLFYPTSSEEVSLVASMMEDSISRMEDTFWVGAHDLLGRGVFVDIKGNDIWAYNNTRWASGEPNHATGDEDCVEMNYLEAIYDSSCEELRPFVCKALAQNITYNTACDTWDEAYFYYDAHKSCYKFHKTPKTWTDAFITCHAEQSYLAIVNDKDEADFIIKGVKATAEDVRGDYVKHFIAAGYHDKLEEGNFVTLHGQSLDTVYNEWDEGEPNNLYNNEHCGTLKTNGLLNDINCDDHRILFVCERGAPEKDYNAIH